MSNSGIFVQEKQEKRGGMSTRQKVCPAPRYQHSQPPHLRHGGDDDRRRAFPPPRRWWQLCETPYFATRGRGDMRGMPNRSTSIAPRRWCGAVLPLWCGVYHLVYHMVACAMTACHHLRGGILGCRLCPPACRRHPGRRNTGLRTAPTAYRGWKLPRLLSAFPLWRSSSDGIPSLVQRIYLIYCKKCALLCEGQGTGIHPQ